MTTARDYRLCGACRTKQTARPSGLCLDCEQANPGVTGPEMKRGGDLSSATKTAASHEGQGQENARPVLVRIADVQRAEVQWRWPSWLPLGKLVVVSGDPGEGKSWMTMALATPITLGQPLPGDTARYQPGNVLVLNAEDGAADTIRPRLEDMGADLTRVVQFSWVEERGALRWIDLSKDMFQLETVLAAGGYQLVIIDPINAYLGGIDAHKDTAIRSVLGPLSALAERYELAIVVLRHLTKGVASKAIYRGIGGIGYTAAARVEWLVGRNPDNPDERIIANPKNNLAPQAKSIAFELVDGQFYWKGESGVTADRLLAVDDGEGRNALTEAISFLQQALREGERPSREVEAEARTQSIKPMTLKRARWELDIATRKEGFGPEGKWLWSLRGSEHSHASAAPKGFKSESNGAAEPNLDSRPRLRGSSSGSEYEPLRESEPLKEVLRGSGVQGREIEPLRSLEPCWICGAAGVTYDASEALRPVCQEHHPLAVNGGLTP